MRKLFITRKIFPKAMEQLSETFSVTINEEETISKKRLIEVVQNYDAILSMVFDPLDFEVLHQAKRLKLIANMGIGLDNIDKEEAKKKNITIYNLPDVGSHATAELTFAILLSLARKISQAGEFVKQGKWNYPSPHLFIGEELYGKTFGIVGLGSIGQEVAKIAHSFGMKVIYYHRRPLELNEDMKKIAKQVDLEELLNHSDFFSLHVPLTEKTKGWIDLNMMKKMKSSSILINTARGGIVKSKDLYIALKEGVLKGAALDVTEMEPISPDDPLLKLDNCLIVPHIGTATKECREKAALSIAKKILDHRFE